MATTGTWLFREDVDRERMLDMDKRLQPVRRASFGVLALALLGCGPWIGWWTIVPLLLAAALFRLADARIEGAEHPEYPLFAAWAGSEVIIAASVALTGGPQIPTMAWFAIPIVTLSARFSLRGIVAGVALTLVLLLAVAFGTGASAVIDDPPLVVAPAALVVAIAMLSTALMRSDLEHRTEAVIDQLTGMLNRRALATRTHELREQSAVTGDPIAVILGDVDDFKGLNDAHGHATGDAVLRHIAYVIRKHLRAFDLAYRMGGEEFLVLVPGADADQAAELAEHLRSAIADERFADSIHVTMSFGVTATARGTTFDEDVALHEADGALYHAKRSGRDRVCVHGAPPPVAVPVG